MFNMDIKLSGLECGACIKLVKFKVGKIDGVKSVDVNLSGETFIISERLINKDEIKNALSETNFKII